MFRAIESSWGLFFLWTAALWGPVAMFFVAKALVGNGNIVHCPRLPEQVLTDPRVILASSDGELSLVHTSDLPEGAVACRDSVPDYVVG